MDLHNATSDVKNTGGTIPTPPYAGLTPCVLPEADAMTVESSQTGVSTDNVPSGKKNGKTETDPKKVPHWYVLRTTYGRERKAYNYLMTQGVEVFYPTVKRVKMIDGRRTTVEESRIPNLFFAFGTEEELRFYVYDKVNLPYLRFYYRKTHVGNRVVSEPLYVPKRQMDTLKIICAVEAGDVLTVPGELKKFREGQTVRVTDGDFKGAVGNVARYKNQQRVGIIVEGLMTVCTAYVPTAFIEIIDVN